MREKSFIVEGGKNVTELIQSDFNVRYVLATPEFISNNTYVLSDVTENLYEVTSKELEELGTFKTNQDCLAVGEMVEFEIRDLDYNDHIFILDNVNDPGNLGTIIRTLDWFGFDKVICSEETTDFYNPKVLNSTMGSFTRVKVFSLDILEFITNSSLPIVGADIEGVSIQEWSPMTPQLIVMGSESHGISPEVQKLIQQKISIAKVGQAESLNVAIATGIFCYKLRS